MARYIVFDAEGAFPLAADGAPLLLDANVVPPTATGHVEIAPGVFAARLVGQRAYDFSPRVGSLRSHAGTYLVARGFGLLRNQEQLCYDPRDGSPLRWGDAGIVARGSSGRAVFPRLDPCVIGLVESADGQRVLLGENRRRPGYFTLIAGYVDVGETIEAAFAREVLEETGRRVRDMRYVCSQPWALSGALMLGMRAVTDDEEAVAQRDGELSRIVWASKADVASLELARPGTIARQMIEAWACGKLGGGHHGG